MHLNLVCFFCAFALITLLIIPKALHKNQNTQRKTSFFFACVLMISATYLASINQPLLAMIFFYILIGFGYFLSKTDRDHYLGPRGEK